jgi:hypothetical protein
LGFPLVAFFMVIGLPVLTLIASGLFALLVFLLDFIVSVMLTRAFLQPIVDALDVVENQAAKDLRRTMHLVVVGSSIAVFSSSIFYVNAIFFFAFKESCSKSVWLNTLVFGINADSILNDVGLLLVCGIFKHWSLQPTFRLDPQYKFFDVQNKAPRFPRSNSRGKRVNAEEVDKESSDVAPKVEFEFSQMSSDIILSSESAPSSHSGGGRGAADGAEGGGVDGGGVDGGAVGTPAGAAVGGAGVGVGE